MGGGEKLKKKKTVRGHSDLNQGPTGLQPGALPLSYIPRYSHSGRQNRFLQQAGNLVPKIFVVRKGIRTPALIRGPEISFLLPIWKQGFHLESGALDHSAILTCCCKAVWKKSDSHRENQQKWSFIPSGDRTQDLWIRSPTRYPLR